MSLEKLNDLVERLRRITIGDPVWVPSKHVYEYPTPSLQVVVVLKLVRASQGIHSMALLCQAGQFADMGVMFRCVSDSVSEVEFLLETYPQQSPHVEKFVKEFFSRTIDGHLHRGNC